MATQIATIDQGGSALSPAAEAFQLMQRKARTFAMSPLVPDQLRKGTPEQAIANCYIALTLAEAMGEVPLIVMQNIHIVNGKAGFASQYMIARANSSGIFKGRIDWRIDKSDPNNLSITAFAVLKDTGQEVSVTCDMKMAAAEQWTKNPKYRTMPEVMLRYRSAAFLVRFYAPDVMLGYQTVEEVADVAIAAGPDLNAAPLTVAQIEHQAAGGEKLVEVDEPAHDPETGEIHDEPDEEAARAADAEAATYREGRDDTDMGEGHNGTDPDHPARGIADDLIARCAAAKIMGDVLNVESDFAKHREAMRDEIADEVDTAIAEARARLKGGK